MLLGIKTVTNTPFNKLPKLKPHFFHSIIIRQLDIQPLSNTSYFKTNKTLTIYIYTHTKNLFHTQNMSKKQQPIVPAWGIRNSFQSLLAILISLILIGGVYLSQNNKNIVGPLEIISNKADKCDLFSGKWIYDNVSYPLYKEKECTYMSDQLACEKFGRRDLEYQFWRWQPHECDLPRLNFLFSFVILV